MDIFSDVQGQLTPQTLVWSCRVSNPLKFLLLSLLPVRIKKIQSKKEELERSQNFPHYNPIGAICCHGNQSSNPIWPKTSGSLSATPLMLLMKFDNIQTAGVWDIHVWKCERTDARADTRTPARVPSYKLPQSLRLRWANNLMITKSKVLRGLQQQFSLIWHFYIWAVTCDFQQCDILTSEDPDEPV